VTELRQITNRNADGVRATLTSTSGLANRARELGAIMDSIVSNNPGANGNPIATPKGIRSSTSRRRKSSAPSDPETKDQS
jgi:hypothetical protein